MKQVTLQLIATVLIAFIVQISYAQVTITVDEFPRGGNFIDSVYLASPINVATPTFGAEQVWDYSSLSMDEFRTIEHFDASGNEDFPNAINHYSSDLIFQGFPITSSAYEALDADGWYIAGREITEVTYPITTITGGQDDILKFVGGNSLYEDRINTLDFPINYSKQWSQSHTQNTHFELSVAAFGLANTPGLRKRIRTQHREVVGYGQLILPGTNGEALPAINVLLTEVEHVHVDSIFLGGAPAPAVLLSAFGLTQGSSFSETYYVFYTPNFGATVLNINLDDFGDVSSVFFRPQSVNMSTNVQDLNQYAVNFFPNPIAKNEVLNIQTEYETYTGDIYFYNFGGQLVYKTNYTSASGHELQLTIPSHLNSGLFSYELRDESGLAIGNGKLVID